jgi:predicted nucleic acid-binding protein
VKLVVDSNIVFSAILSTQGRFGQLLLNGTRHFEFYTIGLLAEEVDRHKQKIMRIAALDEATYQQTVRAILSKLTFVDDIALSDQELRTAMKLTADIDEEDAMFVALNDHLNAHLWTGDRKLTNGLRNKGYDRIITTDEVYSYFLKKELQRRRRKR